MNCTSTSTYPGTGSRSSIFGSSATNCTAVNCTSTNTSTGSSSHSYIFYEPSTNCTAVNCTSTSTGSHSSIFGSSATNCTAVNCTSTRTHTNPAYIFYGTSTNCTAVNCTSADTYSGTNYIFTEGKNCLSWNNDGTEFSSSTNLTTCAGSTYNTKLTLTLGTDNSIARFTNTGFAPAQGVQDVGECPSPVDDPDGYNEWIAAFGDWHPASNSFLLGAGTADEDVTTDADGVTRPDPPSIGAYEAKPA